MKRVYLTAASSLVVVVLSALLVSTAAHAQNTPRLNEAVSSNSSGLVDEYGSASDWLEVHNPTGAAMDLSGWGLSDDAATPLQWVFPNGSMIAAGGYAVIFASGEPSIASELHVPFSLSASGEWLSLSSPDGAVVSALQVPALLTDHSYGIASDNTTAVFSAPTPGSANPAGAVGILTDAVATPARGYYTAPISVVLTHADPAVTLRYTIGVTPPTAATGTIYTGPITIAATSTLRVAGFRDNWITGAPVTHTYVFGDDVPLQAAMYAPFVDEPSERAAVTAGLQTLPTMSIVTDQGINLDGRVRTSVEWIDPAGGPGFQVDAGIQEVGGTSVAYAKDSWRLAFGSEWGESSLDFPVFEGFASNGLVPPTDEFRRLTLRMASHDTNFWANPNFNHRGTWIRGRWGDETMLELGHVNTHGRWVNVFLNGQFWGQYHLRENPDDHFMASYFGGDNAAYVGLNRGVVSSGSGDAWNAAQAAATSWQAFSQWVDPVAYIDWMLINEYQGNFWDLRERQNWRGAGQASAAAAGPGFIFFGSDQDITFADATAATRFPGPASSWNNLIAEADPDFVALLNDRVDVVLRNGGALTTASAIDRWNRMAAQISASIHGEYARWGSYRPAETPANWAQDVADLASVEIAARESYTINRLTDYGLISAVQSPELTGGVVDAGAVIPISNPNGAGTVYVTTDGSDPRANGGGVNPIATAATQVLATESVTISARVLLNGAWSPLTAVALIVPVDAPLVLNEWNAVGSTKLIANGDSFFGAVLGNGGDWFELVVTLDHVDLRGMQLQLSDSDAGFPTVTDTFTFGSDTALSDVRAGTIITIAEALADDLSFAPSVGDWTINLQSNTDDAGDFFTETSQSNFDTNNSDWQLRIFDAAGKLVFGPAGEGAGGVSGVGSTEVGELEANPTTDIGPASGYDDGDTSTFGAPNEFDGGVQDLGPLRSWFSAPADVDCNNLLNVLDAVAIAQFTVGLRTTVDSCDTPRPNNEVFLPAADTNGDGVVNVLDAVTVSQCVAGLNNALCP